MKVAVAQLAPGPDRAQNIQRTIDMIREAAGQGVELVVLPELCTSPYLLVGDALDEWAEDIPDGLAVQRWLREARWLGLYLVAGLLERAGDSYFNTAVVLGPQGLVSRYRKAHLFGWERHRLTAGDDGFHVARVQDVRVGVLICYDLRFPEAVRLLALAGAQVLCVPTTWTDVGKPQPLDGYGWCAAAHLAVGYAYANRVFVLCAGRVGREGTVQYLGNSLVVGPGGQVLAGPADPNAETVLVAEVDPLQADDKRVGPDNDVVRDRRTDLYVLAVAPGPAARWQESP